MSDGNAVTGTLTPDAKFEIAPDRPDAMPAGIEEAPALICDSRELTTPDGKAVTGRLAPEGRAPDGRPTPGTEVVPALIWERSELTTPDGKAVTGRLTPDGRFEAAGRPDCRPGIEVTPALI
jgi:hypothetical protein